MTRNNHRPEPRIRGDICPSRPPASVRDNCHYQAFSEEVLEPFKAEEPEAWLVMWIDSESVDKHILNHSDGALVDTLISDGDHDMPAQFDLYDFITVAECQARDGDL